MYKIVSINNETHAVTLSHEDGDKFSFVVPAEHTQTHDKKVAYIQSQMDARDKKMVISKTLKAVKAAKKLYFLYAVIAIETAALVALLIKVL